MWQGAKNGHAALSSEPGRERVAHERVLQLGFMGTACRHHKRGVADVGDFAAGGGYFLHGASAWSLSLMGIRPESASLFKRMTFQFCNRNHPQVRLRTWSRVHEGPISSLASKRIGRGTSSKRNRGTSICDSTAVGRHRGRPDHQAVIACRSFPVSTDDWWGLIGQEREATADVLPDFPVPGNNPKLRSWGQGL